MKAGGFATLCYTCGYVSTYLNFTLSFLGILRNQLHRSVFVARAFWDSDFGIPNLTPEDFPVINTSRLRLSLDFGNIWVLAFVIISKV